LPETWISTSLVARVIGVSHCTQLALVSS
jgi:hypothetical protein